MVKNSSPLVYVAYLRGINLKQVPLALDGQAWRCQRCPSAHVTVAGFRWSMQFTHGRIKRHNILALFVLSGGLLLFVLGVGGVAILVMEHVATNLVLFPVIEVGVILPLLVVFSGNILYPLQIDSFCFMD